MTVTTAPFTAYDGETLPLDLDGDPYRDSDGLGHWKMTRCCGAAATGTEWGIACKNCYAHSFNDGPARLRADVATAEVIAEACIAYAMAQIVEDVEAGVVPGEVADFSALHDHVDANEYVMHIPFGDSDDPDANHADVNAATDAIDTWIRGGALRRLPATIAKVTADVQAAIIDDVEDGAVPADVDGWQALDVYVADEGYIELVATGLGADEAIVKAVGDAIDDWIKSGALRQL